MRTDVGGRNFNLSFDYLGLLTRSFRLTEPCRGEDSPSVLIPRRISLAKGWRMLRARKTRFIG